MTWRAVQHRLGVSGAAGAWASWRPWLPAPWAGLGATLERERQRWLLWLPVALAAGIVGFFSLPGEPPSWSGWLAGAVAAMLAAGAAGARRGGVTGRDALLLGLAAAALGFMLAQARLHAVAAPILTRPALYRVEGRIVERTPLPRGDRIVVQDPTLAGVAPEATPARIRINLRRAPADLAPGDRVRVLARLQPPLPPALPGAYDFGRQAWFERLGAIGFAVGPAERVDGGTESLSLRIAAMRASIAARIAAVSPGPSGAMAAALIAGVQEGLDQATWRDLRISGLAHLVSVSGLHMVLVAGGVLAACRWLLALCPPLALRFPVRKIAAVVAMAAAAFYLVLSGASVPTQRSFLMTAVALLAIVADRNPFSLRLLAWAAVVVLLVRPESVLGTSFQLSFAAVLALMAIYEGWRGLQRDEEDVPTGRWAPIGRYLVGVCVTTLVASAATTPFAAFHFQTIPTYGVLANLIAVPLTSFLVMPAGMVGLLLLPLGLDGPAFQVMAWGVQGVLLVAHGVASLPGASVLVRQWPSLALVALALGGLWLALWRERWRWLGLLPCMVAAALVLLSRPPDLLVDRLMGMAAVRHADGTVTMIEWRRDRLVKETWLRHLGVAVPLAAPKPGAGTADGVTCDEVGCIVAMGAGRVSLAHGVEAAVEDCGLVDLVIARVGPERCRRDGDMIGPWGLRDAGGIAVAHIGGQIEVSTVAASRGDWPWARRPSRKQTYKLNLDE